MFRLKEKLAEAVEKWDQYASLVRQCESYLNECVPVPDENTAWHETVSADAMTPRRASVEVCSIHYSYNFVVYRVHDVFKVQNLRCSIAPLETETEPKFQLPPTVLSLFLISKRVEAM